MYCVIPARGGSKGIPNKNIVSLLGYPLLAWSIVPAQDAGLTVIVSTDDDEIAAVANSWGAAAFMRRDTVGDGPTEDVLNEVVRQASITKPFFFMQCTSPFTLREDLVGAKILFDHDEADSMFSAYPLFPYLWTNDVAPMYNPRRRKRRQDKRPTWLENGAFYITSPDVLAKGARVGEKTVVWLMDTWLEIDEPRDLDMAAWMLNTRQEFAQKVSRMAERSSSVGTAGLRRRPTTSQGNSLHRGFHALL